MPVNPYTIDELIRMAVIEKTVSVSTMYPTEQLRASSLEKHVFEYAHKSKVEREFGELAYREATLKEETNEMLNSHRMKSQVVIMSREDLFLLLASQASFLLGEAYEDIKNRVPEVRK